MQSHAALYSSLLLPIPHPSSPPAAFFAFLLNSSSSLQQLYTSLARTTRFVLVLMVALCVVMFLTFLRMSGDMGSHRDPTLLFIAAVAELAAFGFILCYFLTLLPNFNKTRLYIVLVERRATSIMAPFQVDSFLTTDKRIAGSNHLLRRTSRRFARAGFDVLSTDAGGIIPHIRRLLTPQPKARSRQQKQKQQQQRAQAREGEQRRELS